MAMSWFYFIVIGALAGWLAGTFMRGHGFGIFGDIGVGAVGAILGGLVFGILGLSSYNLLGSLVTVKIGAMLLLFLVRYARRA
jgi:uncharacterized membrane protein YeaQ/YmgE (transglycosylase-associated protein family)